MNYRLAVAAAFAFACASSFAMTRRDDRTDAQMLAEGALFPAVGQVWAGATWQGSGTLVAPNFVMTAGHVSDTFSGGNGRVNFGGTFYNVAQVFVNPGWTGSLLAGTDMSLLRLSSNVAGVTPMGIYYGTSYIGRAAHVAGFGGTGTGTGGWTGTYDMLKRSGTNTVDALNFTYSSSTFTNTAVMDFDNPQGTQNTLGYLGSGAAATNLEMNVIFGDSGGALIFDEAGTPMLSGVTSWLWNTNAGAYGNYGELSGFAAVIGQRNWIRSVLVPEPATLAAFGIFLPVLLRRRKK